MRRFDISWLAPPGTLFSTDAALTLSYDARFGENFDQNTDENREQNGCHEST